MLLLLLLLYLLLLLLNQLVLRVRRYPNGLPPLHAVNVLVATDYLLVLTRLLLLRLSFGNGVLRMRLLHLGLLERELLLLLLLLLDWRWLSQLRPRILFELLLSKIIVSGLLVEH